MTVLKSIVVCLALANVGYFLWRHGIANSQAVPNAAPSPLLKLVSEAGPPRQSDAAAAPGSNPPSMGDSAPATPADALHCVTVGPFKEVSEAAHAASTLRGSGYDPRQRVVDGEVWAGVWVYIPLPASQASGEQMMSKLKAAGIDDALEMPGPNDGSVISLGLYSEQKRAQSRVAQAQSLGLSPAIADRKRNGNVYWIDIDMKPTDQPVNPAELQADAARASHLEATACPGPGAAAP